MATRTCGFRLLYSRAGVRATAARAWATASTPHRTAHWDPDSRAVALRWCTARARGLCGVGCGGTALLVASGAWAACDPLGARPGAGNTAALDGLCGVWVQDKAACDSLCPFISGLGMPGAVAICRIVDAITVTLRISLHPDSGTVSIVDKTILGRNETRVQLGGPEVLHTTRGGRKRFMMSGWTEGHGDVVIRCRLFERGEGWETLMARSVQPDGRLLELNTLRRPGEPDVVVRRYFRKMGELEARTGMQPAGMSATG